MKRALYSLLLLFPLLGNTQVISIETIIPPNVYVCPDSFQVTVYVINNSTTLPAQSLTTTHNFPVGIELVSVDSTINVDGSNLTNLNAPEFLTNSLALSDTIKLYLTVKVDCDYPSSQAQHATTVDYTYNSSSITVTTTTNSYNILKPALNLAVINNSNVVANMADTVDRVIEICNYGFQPIDLLTFTADASPDVIRCQYHLYGTAGDSLILDTSSVISIDSNLLLTLTGTTTLDPNDCIQIIETVKVDSCTGTPTTYEANYSCDAITCQSAFDDATINVIPGNPLVTITEITSSAIETSYCSSTLGHLQFEYKGAGSDAVGGAPGNSYATDLKVHLRYTFDFINLKNVTIAGVPLSSIPGINTSASWQYVVRDSIFVIDFSSVTGNPLPGVIFDLDNDGFYDDLPNDSTFLVDMDIDIECASTLSECPRDFTSYFYIMNAGVSYKDQCGSFEENWGLTTGDGIRSLYTAVAEEAVMVLPPDVHENTPFNMSICPVGGHGYANQYPYEMTCSTDSLVAAIYMPDGYTLAPGADSITIVYNITTSIQDSVRVPLVEIGDTIFIPIGTIPSTSIECFDLPLTFICNGDPILLANGSIPDIFSFELIYICEEGCGCTEIMSCGTVSTFHHCLGPCDAAIQTSSFSVERNSFGWQDAPSYTRAQRAIAPKVTSATPGIRLDAAYPCDSVCAIAVGHIGTISDGVDSVFVQLRYQVPADSLIFDFISGTFEVVDPSTNTIIATCTATDPVISDTGVAPNKMYFMDFYIPTSCISGSVYSSSDSLRAKIYLKYREEAGQEIFGNSHGFHYMDKFRAEYKLVDTLGIVNNSCDHFGSNFTLLKPYTGIRFYSPPTECNPVTVQFRHQTNPGFKALDIEDFPNEFRNSIAIEDTIDFYFPTGWEYLSAQYNFNNQDPGWSTNSLTPDLILSDNEGDTMLRFVRDWELTDIYLNTIQSNFQWINVTMQPTCAAAESDFHHITETAIRQHYADDLACYDSVIGVRDIYVGATIKHKVPGLNIPPISDTVSLKNIITWDFQYCNTLSATNTDADFAWLGIENPSGDLQLLDVLLNGSPLPSFSYSLDTSKLFVQVDTLLLDNTCLNLTLIAKNTNCDNINELDSVIVFGGYDCTGFPANTDSTTCGDTMAIFRFTVEPVSIAMIGSVPTSINICESTPYSISVTNTDIGSLCNPSFYLDIPTGFVLDSACYTYPTTASCINLPAMSPGFGPGGAFNGWDIDSIALNNLGLTGVGNLATNEIQFTVYITPVCGITSNDFISFNFAGINTCSDTLVETFQTLPTIFNGIAGMTSSVISLQASNIQACDSTSLVQITIVNTGAVPSGTSDSFTFTAPNQLNYNNQFNGIINPPTTTSPVQTSAPGLSLFTWDLPAGILPGDSSVFTFEISLTPGISCGPFTLLANNYASDSLYCALTGDSCYVSVEGGSTSINIEVDPPNASFTAPATICVGDQLTVSSQSCDTWNWDFGNSLTSTDSTVITSYSTAGVYIITHIVSSFCGSDTSWRSIKATEPTIAISNDTTICKGECVSLFATGGVSYSWSPTTGLINPTSATPTACPTSTTIYSVTVIDADGCSGSSSVTVTIAPPAIVNAGPDQSICLGNSTTLAGSGSGPIFLWSPSTGLSSVSISNPIASPTITTTYTLTTTTDLGCSATDSMTVVVTPLPDASFTAVLDTCMLSINSFTSNFTGGTHLWDFGDFVNSALVNPTHIYTSANNFQVTHIVSNSCGSDTATLFVPIVDCEPAEPCFIDYSAGIDRRICEGSCTNLNAFSPSAVSYSWSPTVGLSNPNIYNPVACPTVTTTYVVTVTDNDGCTATDSVTVFVNNVFAEAYIDDTIHVCANNLPQSFTLGGAPTGPAGSICSWSSSPFPWLVNIPWIFTSPTDCNPTLTIPAINPSSPICLSFVVTVIDGITDCVARDTVVVCINPRMKLDLSTTVTSCIEPCSAIATVTPFGGVGPYTYQWNDPSSQTTATAIGLCSGTYTVTVTDANGCTATDSIQAASNAIFAEAYVDDTIHVCANNLPQSFTLGGAPTGPSGSICSWSSSPFPWLVNIPTFFSPSANDCNPTLSIPAFNPANQLCISFVVTVIDPITDCSAKDTVVVCISPRMELYMLTSIASCNLPCDAIATAVPIGGVGPYTYQWNDPASQTTATATGLCPGNYTVIVTDANGCTASISETIYGDVAPQFSPFPTQVCSNGSAFLLTATGSMSGNGTFTSSCAPSGIIGPLTFGPNTYWVFVPSISATGICVITFTNDNGCSISQEILVEACCDPFTINTSSNSAVCSAICNGSASVSVTGGSGSYSYQWNDPATQTSATASGLCPGSYTVIITDNNTECMDTVTVTVQSKFKPKCVNFDNVVCITDDKMLLKCKGNGVFTGPGVLPGTPFYFSPAAAGIGTHTITYTVPSGCTYTFTITVLSEAECDFEGLLPSERHLLSSWSFESSYYPNPTDEIGFYEYSGLADGGTFELVNVLGELLLEIDLSEESGRLELNLSTLPAGVYMYQVRSNGQLVDNDKIVVAR